MGGMEGSPFLISGVLSDLVCIAQNLHNTTQKHAYLFASLKSSSVQCLQKENNLRSYDPPELMFTIASPMYPLKGRNYSFHLLLFLEYFSENAEFPNTERYFSLQNF